MKLDNLQALTDSIKAGERVVFFPPGMFSLIALVMLLLVDTVLFTTSCLTIFYSDVAFQQQVLIQFFSIGVLIVFVIFPNLMVLSGKKKFSIMSYSYAWFLLVCAAFMLVLGLSGLLALNKVTAIFLAISFILSLICILIYRSAAYLLVKEFFYQLKNPEVNE